MLYRKGFIRLSECIKLAMMSVLTKAVKSFYHHDDYDTNDNDNNDNNDNDVNDGEEEYNDNDKDGDNVVVFLGFFISTVLRCRSLSKTGLNVTADLV